MLVAIQAIENEYGGLHGIEDLCIIEVSDIRAAECVAADMSRELMQNYCDILENFEEEASAAGLEEGTEEYNEYVEECINDNISYQIWEVVDVYADISTMDDDFYNNKEEFVKEHCKEIE